MTYRKQKERARERAILWQRLAGSKTLYASELAYWSAYFERLGKRYGLLKEYRENGII